MNKNFIILTALTLFLCVLFTSCDSLSLEETSVSPDIITEAPVSDNKEAVTSTKKADETETEIETTEEASSAGTLIGFSLKGYPITQKDGITYVDGVLIANKTYSLPENYNPGKLLNECSSAFEKMKAAAAKEGLNLWVASGFRSYELQQSLYTRYSQRDGKEAADRYSARPGHSEHQTGLAIDLNSITSAFANTKEGKWVAENCHEYGFILRYPKEKETQTGYMYEAWHIRYVGVEVAKNIYESGLCLEEYYGITSVYASSGEEITEAPALQESTTLPEETTLLAEETTALTEITEAVEETTEIIITD